MGKTSKRKSKPARPVFDLRVDQEVYPLYVVQDDGQGAANYHAKSGRYILDLSKPLLVCIHKFNINISICPSLLLPRGDADTGGYVVVPLTSKIALHIHGVHLITPTFIEKLYHSGADPAVLKLVREREGWHAVSCVGIQIDRDDVYQMTQCAVSSSGASGSSVY